MWTRICLAIFCWNGTYTAYKD